MSSDSARDRANVEELVAALSRISVLNDTDRSVASEAATTIESLHAEVERLAAQVRWLSGKPFRPSREKVPPGQLALDLLEMLTANGVGSGDAGSPDASADADESPDESTDRSKTPKKRRKRRARDLEHKIVESRLDGEVSLVEGIHHDRTSGQKVHHALAMISWDPEGGLYRFRSTVFGRGPGDFEGRFEDGDFVWGGDVGHGEMRYRITIEDDTWSETGEFSRDGGETWSPFFGMELRRESPSKKPVVDDG